MEYNYRHQATQHLLYSMANLGQVRKHGPRIIVRGHDCYVWDIDGKRYIDGFAGLQLTNVGHGRKEIADAVTRQMGEIEYWHLFAGFCNLPAVKLSSKLADLAPGNLQVTHFVNSGSEAADSAFKIARQYQRKRGFAQKYKIIYRNRAYHGMTMGATSAAGDKAFRAYHEPLVPGFIRIPNNHCYRCHFGLSYPMCDLQCARVLETTILEEGPETVAAFIADPVQGSTGGYIPPVPEYIPMVREICRKYNVLYIDDEVITGFGRTGKMFGIEHWQQAPDIMIVAKGLSSGYLPVGAVIMTSEIADTLQDEAFLHGMTYGGHPACAAAALANLEIVERESLPARAARMQGYVMERLRSMLDYSIVGEVRGIGMMYALEIVRDKSSKESFAQASARIVEIAAEKGLILRVGSMGGSVLMCPPLIMTEELADEMLDIVSETISEVSRELGML
ncbi:MAG: aspartate aminotransferase family protein [Bacillota bacterium]